MYSTLSTYLESLDQTLQHLSPRRREALHQIANYAGNRDKARMNFICTHNSRRSQFAQIWLHVILHYRQIEGPFEVYSGGTEVTAFNIRAVQALCRAGLKIDRAQGENPQHSVYFSEETPALNCYSKLLDASENPRENFAAVMTCSEADEDCPYVPGADRRFSLPFKDPKSADGTHREETVYDERCRHIAAEMLYLADTIKENRS